MSVLHLSEADVEKLIDMPTSITVVEEAFRQFANGKAANVPRARVGAPGVMLHTMSASAEYLGLVGWKAYTTTKSSMRFHVAAYDIATGAMRALIDANWLGQLRTGAASGVATKFLANPNASTVGLIGTGLQARTQLMAMCEVRPIKRVEVFSRDAARRSAFATEMQQRCGVDVVPVESAQQAVSGKDIVITATYSKQPVFDGRDLQAGCHVNAVGSNYWSKTELDVETIRRCGAIVCDSIEQCRVEAGDFAASLAGGVTSWDAMRELSHVVSGKAAGRADAQEITLFKSVGLALEDIALAGELINRAEQQGVGREIEWLM